MIPLYGSLFLRRWFRIRMSFGYPYYGFSMSFGYPYYGYGYPYYGYGYGYPYGTAIPITATDILIIPIMAMITDIAAITITGTGCIIPITDLYITDHAGQSNQNRMASIPHAVASDARRQGTSGASPYRSRHLSIRTQKLQRWQWCSQDFIRHCNKVHQNTRQQQFNVRRPYGTSTGNTYNRILLPPRRTLQGSSTTTTRSSSTQDRPVYTRPSTTTSQSRPTYSGRQQRQLRLQVFRILNIQQAEFFRIIVL